MTTCALNRNHEATGYYRSRNHSGEYYLCEACAESLTPRPTLIYAVMTRLEAEHS